VDPVAKARPSTVVGRYEVHDPLASGGMATVHIGRLIGPVGFSRTVAVKVLHRHYATDAAFVAMFVDEARLAARIRHPNVVSTLDVVVSGDEVSLVMDYVAGETVSRLLRLSVLRGSAMPPAIVSAMMVDVLDGLHAAHEAKDEQGEPLHIVHRDVSPQNLMVGQDGTARVLDFGIAKAASREQATSDGQVKGKLPYMSPEQVTRQHIDRRTDVFAAAVVLWEALTQRRLFDGDNPGAIVANVVAADCPAPSTFTPTLPPAVDAVVARGLAQDREARYATAQEFARALEEALPPARRAEVGAWVTEIAAVALADRARRVADIERGSPASPPGKPVVEMLTTPGGPSPMTLPSDRQGAASTATRDDDADRPSSRPRRGAYAAVAVAAVVSVVVLLGIRRPAPSVGASAATDVVAAPAAASPPPSAPPSLPASVVVTSPPAPVPVAPATRSVPRHPGKTTRGCDPPYTFNDAGVKRWKAACL